MRPLALLKCLGKALLRHGGQALGLCWAGGVAVSIAEDVWAEWGRKTDEERRRAQLEAIVCMAAQQFRGQVEEVVREAAAGQPPEVSQQLSRCLESLPALLRSALCRPEDWTGRSVPPDVPLRDSRDLAALLTGESPHTGEGQGPAVRVTLTFSGEAMPVQELVFEDRGTCLVGRALDCNPRIPDPPPYRAVSRHHCLLDVNPPDVVVRDLGSLGGTYVNGTLIGQRPGDMTAEQGRLLKFPEHDLKDGDELQLCQGGIVVCRVQVSVPARCVQCGIFLPEDRKAGCERTPGVYQCEACRRKAAEAQQPRPLRACPQCGRDVTDQIRGPRHGELVCADCRNMPEPPVIPG
jgi:FHA domain